MDINKLSFNPSLCFINGKWIQPHRGKFIELTNPSNGKILCKISRGSSEDIDHAVKAAENSAWVHSTALERGRVLLKMSQIVLNEVELLAELEANDVGKPLTQARGDAIALARYLEFYGGASDKIHGETIPYLKGYTVYTLREPHGVTGHIVPWNYPMQIIGRSIGASLAMGNTTVLKPAEEACLSALAFADIARRAGLPEGALNVVPGLGSEAGASLACHPGINHISFTGSEVVGKKIQAAAAKNVVPVTLELGGKSPQIVFEDADLEAALPFLVNSGIQNAGQTCSAASRILIQKSVFNKVKDMMGEKYRALRVGPAIDDLDLGPLISKRQKEIVLNFLELGKGLKIVAKGSISQNAPETGFYIQPTLFEDVPYDHKLAQEEIFGPVQVLIPFDTEDEAIHIANSTSFGLVASIWTNNGARQMRMAKELKCGQVFINNYGAGGGVELPFGGVGRSGHGREKGFEALYGFSTLKTIAAFHG
ncbi:MAG: aldehyde dehydrogenase family protein [Paracoccaceae bacterium]|jgi:aldehyde dehydrogenase (NAD+)|nr:aldehyde dehydrogenase family protein [Paracoccaceae bacterium]